MSSATTVDQRTIGELLLDADFQARQLLLDVVGDDASAMLRTWGEVVQAAGDLWASLPTSTPGRPVDDPSMRRLETMSQGQHRTQLKQGWPGEGPADERLLSIADNFQRATELAAGPGRQARPTSEPARADLNAARMRVMHTLYVSAHAVGMAIHQHINDVRTTADNHSSMRDTRGIPRGQDAAIRIGTFEQLAGGYIGNRFSRAIAGEHHTPPWGTGRLHQALTSWDIQAHRTLATTPTVANLHLIAHTQAFVAAASTAILEAASATDRLDRDAYQHRLAPALDSSQEAWARTASRWGALISRGERGEPALMHASNEVRAAGTAVAFDRTHWATPAVMAGRVDLAEAATSVQQAMIAGAELTCAYRDVVEQEPHLAGSARTLLAWTQDASTNRAARMGHEADDEAAIVPPGAVFANRAVAVPDLVRQALVGEAQHLVDVSDTAMSASNAITGVVRKQLDESTGCIRCRPEEKDRSSGPAAGLSTVSP